MQGILHTFEIDNGSQGPLSLILRYYQKIPMGAVHKELGFEIPVDLSRANTLLMVADSWRSETVHNWDNIYGGHYYLSSLTELEKIISFTPRAHTSLLIPQTTLSPPSSFGSYKLTRRLPGQPRAPSPFDDISFWLYKQILGFSENERSSAIPITQSGQKELKRIYPEIVEKFTSETSCYEDVQNNFKLLDEHIDYVTYF